LKRREKISGRFADALAWMYMTSATLKRFWDEGQRAEDVPFVRWSCDMALHKVQVAMDGLLANFPNRLTATLLRPVIFPLGARFHPPTDRLGAAVARELLDGRPARERLSGDVFVPPDHEPGLGRLEWALRKVTAAAAVEDKVKAAVRARALPRKLAGAALVQAALSAGVINDAEQRILADAAAARDEVIQVDAFPREAMERHVATVGADAGSSLALTAGEV
jgi:acyl-CoA dehydrogenase